MASHDKVGVQILDVLFLACKCNPGGALYGNCDKRNGKCQCRKNIGGTRCDRFDQSFSSFIYSSGVRGRLFKS